MEIHLTHHAAKRMKERLGIKSLAEKQRMAELAFERGKFVEIQEREHFGVMDATMLLEYNNRVFVFSKERNLITVLPGNKKTYESKQGLLNLVVTQEAKTAIAYA